MIDSLSFQINFNGYEHILKEYVRFYRQLWPRVIDHLTVFSICNFKKLVYLHYSPYLFYSVTISKWNS